MIDHIKYHIPMNATSPDDFPDFTGLIFNQLSRNRNWKITGKPYRIYHSYNYPVIRCTKTGKEYKDTNGFNADMIIRIWNQWIDGSTENSDSKYMVVGLSEKKEEVSTDGSELGNAKRRVRWIRSEIKRLSNELNELENKHNLEDYAK